VRGGVAKLTSFAKKPNRSFLQETRLQKCDAKGTVYARTFATPFNEDRLRSRIHAGSEVDLQLKALKSAGCQKIFREKVSGATRTSLSLSECWIRFDPAIPSSSGSRIGWRDQLAIY
jgi:hypothetical protein